MKMKKDIIFFALEEAKKRLEKNDLEAFMLEIKIIKEEIRNLLEIAEFKSNFLERFNNLSEEKKQSMRDLLKIDF